MVSGKEITAIFIFLLIYYIYTVFIVYTATAAEAFKAGRLHFYIYAAIFFAYYFRDKKLQIYFWIILKISLLFHTFVFIVMFFIQDNFIIQASWQFAPFPRLYIYTYTNAFIIFLAYILQLFVKYKGYFKINIFYFFCSLVVIVSSLGRGYWIGIISSLALVLILLLNNIEFKKKLTISKSIKYTLAGLILMIISYGFIMNTEYGAVILDRVFNVEKDVLEGEGTLSGRQYSFEGWMLENYNLGLEYTGLGFPHSKSEIISSKKYLPGTEQAWGTESEILQKLLNFGYIGYGIWVILLLTLIYRIFISTKILGFSFSLIIGLSIIGYITSVNFISGNSGQISNWGTIAFFIGFYEGVRFSEFYNQKSSYSRTNY